MTMPEAPMGEYGSVVSRKYKVWPPRQIPGMQPVAKSPTMQSSTQHKLWFCVGASDPTHVEPSLCRRQDIDHVMSSVIVGQGLAVLTTPFSSSVPKIGRLAFLHCGL
jgi:hypothetical protein